MYLQKYIVNQSVAIFAFLREINLLLQVNAYTALKTAVQLMSPEVQSICQTG